MTANELRTGLEEASAAEREDCGSGTGKESSASAAFDENVTKRALDQLFTLARQFNSTEAYAGLLKFIKSFRAYSPFNALLVCIQMPGAVFVATPARWHSDYGRTIKANARPLVILQPMGPVMFVFDVAETEPGPNARPLPSQVTDPFRAIKGQIRSELQQTIENAKRDGIEVLFRSDGSQSAGLIGLAPNGQTLSFQTAKRPEVRSVKIPRKYSIVLNENCSAETSYATLVHELAHLYCGHLGTPNSLWWPDRAHTPHDIEELEAESVSYIVCGRLNIDTQSEEYISDYVRNYEQTPPISLESVMKAAGLIEQMGRERLKLRKEKQT